MVQLFVVRVGLYARFSGVYLFWRCVGFFILGGWDVAVWCLFMLGSRGGGGGCIWVLCVRVKGLCRCNVYAWCVCKWRVQVVQLLSVHPKLHSVQRV